MIVKVTGHALGWIIFYFVFFVKFVEFIRIILSLLSIDFFLQKPYLLIFFLHLMHQLHYLLLHIHRNYQSHIAKESMFPQYLQNSIMIGMIKLLHNLSGLAHEFLHQLLYLKDSLRFHFSSKFKNFLPLTREILRSPTLMVMPFHFV